MNKKLTTIGLLTLAAWIAAPGLGSAEAQDGPVRQGLRNTAQGVGQAAQRAGQATRNVAEGAARGTAEAVRRTGDAARNVTQGARDAIRGNAQPYQGQYRSGYRGNAYNSNGGYVDGNYQGQAYSQGQWNQSGNVHQLRYDSCGREWICVNGQRVYVTQSTSSQGQPTMNNNSGQQPDMAPPAPNADQNYDASQQPGNDQAQQQQRFNAQAAEAAAQADLSATPNPQGANVGGSANLQGDQASGLDTPAPPANADAQSTGASWTLGSMPMHRMNSQAITFKDV